MEPSMPRVGAQPNVAPQMMQPRSPLIKIGDAIINSIYIINAAPSEDGRCFFVTLRDGKSRSFTKPEEIAALKGYFDFLAWDISIFAKNDLAKSKDS